MSASRVFKNPFFRLLTASCRNSRRRLIDARKVWQRLSRAHATVVTLRESKL